jgi:hypothetical protein
MTIPPECSIEFTVTRQSLASTQTAQFKIFGLGPTTRELIYKDRFDWTQFRAIQFFAGYDGFMPRIFNGTILQAYSEKKKEETVTIIDAYDGGNMMTNGWTNTATAGAKTRKEVLNQLGASLPNIQGPPIVGDFPTVNMRGEVLNGNTWDLIRQQSDDNCTISDGIVYVLQPTEGLLNGQVQNIATLSSASSTIPVINSATGLLGAPRRSGVFVEWEMLFEPRLQLFQIVDIQSTFNPKFNGAHKTMGFRHHGMVSKSVTGDYQTTASFLFGKGNTFSAAVAALAG